MKDKVDYNTPTVENRIKTYNIRIPYPLRSHPDFKNVQIRIDEDHIHFTLPNRIGGLPEIWVYDATKQGWAQVKFITDFANKNV